MTPTRFRILGPLEVVADGVEVWRPRGKQGVLLAILLLHPNEVVSRDRLMDGLWGESPPETAGTALHGLVSQLRRRLALVDGDAAVVTQAPGYLVRVDAEAVDSAAFERLLDEGRQALAERRLEDASATLTQALALWRGPPLDGLAAEPFPRAEVARLEEDRLAALEERLDADLTLGRHAALVGELRELVVAHPGRERLRAQLMLALYRCGREVEALEAYRDFRRSLDAELGLEPGPELRGLERAILRQDAALAAPARPANPHRARPRRWIIAAAAAVLVAAGVATFIALDRPTAAEPLAVEPHTVAVIDPATNSLVADIPTGGYPGPLAADNRWIYVCNIGDATMTRIDPRTRRAFDTFSFSRAIDLVARDGHLWAANGGAPGHTPLGVQPGTVLDYAPGPTWRSIRVGPEQVGGEAQTTLAADARGPAIWAGNQDSRTIRQIDSSTDRTLMTIEGVAPAGLAAVGDSSGGDVVWASDTARKVVVRIDEVARRVTRRVRVSGGPGRLVADDGDVWVLTARGRYGEPRPTAVAHPSVIRIDARTNRVLQRIPLSVTPIRAAIGAGSVWISGQVVTDGHGTSRRAEVVRIDEASGRILARIPLRTRAADGILYAHGLVWVAIPASQ